MVDRRVLGTTSSYISRVFATVVDDTFRLLLMRLCGWDPVRRGHVGVIVCYYFVRL